MPHVSIEIQLKTLPSNPGVYQFYDAVDKILYVGKAKNLKKRVSSYFTKNHEYGKTRVMVKKIARIDHIVVPTESDALLLENNLIKKYRPRYNVLLKDDKSYPWICIKKERFPRIFPTRKLITGTTCSIGFHVPQVLLQRDGGKGHIYKSQVLLQCHGDEGYSLEIWVKKYFSVCLTARYLGSWV